MQNTQDILAQFKEKYKTEDFCIWMFSKEDKRRIIDDVFGLFYEKFGFYPASTGSYFLDAYTINYIKENNYDFLRVVYVGDSKVDGEFAKAVGIKSCVVLYGYDTKENIMLTTPDFMPKNVKNLREILL